ncbi:capsule polysaccharide transporter [Pseudooceanicola nitratireducens]|uniref:sugar transporter n=1 Tax=Pseudooceanicola nitratireducens TaxID=517719 RepID=UPI0031045320
MAQQGVRKLKTDRKPALPEGFPTLVEDRADKGTAAAARLRFRHRTAIASFLLMVLMPIAATGWYLFARAVDQFSSHLGFVVHSEDPSSYSGLASLPLVAAFGGASSPDADILEAYLTSQALVEAMDDRFSLRESWSQTHETDPVFAFSPVGSIEDLTRYWSRMVKVDHDHGSGIIAVEIRGFDPERTQDIGIELQRLGSDLINRIGDVARTDRLRHSKQELQLAEERLSMARQVLTTFRLLHRIVDPIADLQGDMAVIHQLQQNLADERISLDLLRRNLAAGSSSARQGVIADSRIVQSERRIEAIRGRIEEERQAFGDAGGQRDLARLMGDYEERVVAVELAQDGYALALAAHEANRAAANLQTRYLASYSPPTLAERPIYPKRWSILASVGFAAFLLWATVVLFGYGLRDRFQ